MLARSKVNSIESKIREALLNKKISHEDFTTIINEEKKLEVSIRMMKTQKIIEEDKRKDIDKIIRQNDKKL